MLSALLELFKQPQQQRSEHSLALASAVLLVEIMRADHDIDEYEKQTFVSVLQNSLGLSPKEADDLMKQAIRLTDTSNDLQQFTKVIHAQCDTAEKFVLLSNLWRIAYASHGLDRYEEHMIRRISELLYIPHSEFIRAKLTVRDAMAGEQH